MLLEFFEHASCVNAHTIFSSILCQYYMFQNNCLPQIQFHRFPIGYRWDSAQYLLAQSKVFIVPTDMFVLLYGFG